MEEFKTAYGKSKTWADLENAINENLTVEQMKELIAAHELVKKSTGLDMRQDFTLGILKGILKMKGAA